MRINIAIVEDDDLAADLIVGYIKRFEKENGGDEFLVTRYKDGEEITADFKPQYDIIFMDIQMKIMDGMSAAEYLRKFDKDVILIFITNMSQYAIKGYKVGALDFLLKPVPYFAFSEQLKRSVDKLRQNRKSYLLLPREDGVLRLDISSIVYVESRKHKMQIVTNEQSYELQITMQELESQLNGHDFFRIHKGYLVNLAYVTGVFGGEVIAGNYKLLLSRARRKLFLESLAGFFGKVVQ